MGRTENKNDWQDAPLMPYRGYQARSTHYNWYLRRSPDRDYETMRIEPDARSICSHGSHSGSYMMPTTSSNGTRTSGNRIHCASPSQPEWFFISHRTLRCQDQRSKLYQFGLDLFPHGMNYSLPFALLFVLFRIVM